MEAGEFNQGQPGLHETFSKQNNFLKNVKKKTHLTMHFWTLTTQQWVFGSLRVFSEDDPGLAPLKRQRKQIQVMTEQKRWRRDRM